MMRPLSAWAPIQPIASDRPAIIWITISSQTVVDTGYSNGTIMPAKAKAIITRRVPSRSINTPPWCADS